MILGWIGKPYDLMLYIARTLTKLNQRVLIIDLSNDDELKTYIKHGMDLDSNKCIVNYRDLNYTKKIPEEKEIEEFKNGTIFVISENAIESPLKADKNYVSLNIMPSNIVKANNIIKNLNNENISIIIRDIISIEDFERVKEHIEKKLDEKYYNYFYYSLEDFENYVNCQINQIIRFDNVSSQIQNFIKDEIKNLYPNINNSLIKKAIKIASKGV